jgi:hypothetical protein
MKPILSASYQDCHVKGMDSIVFKLQAPMVRVYIARSDHTLWMNDPWVTKDYNMSLGLHRHRTDITMTPLFGHVYNIFESLAKQEDAADVYLSKHTYQSRLVDGATAFRRIGNYSTHFYLRRESLRYPTLLPGDKLHSVYVPKGEMAAWMILEGAPNDEYQPLLWSNDLRLADTNRKVDYLYQHMTETRLADNMGFLNHHLGPDFD